MCGCDGFAIRELDMDWFGGRLNVRTWPIDHDEVSVAVAISNCMVWNHWWGGPH